MPTYISLLRWTPKGLQAIKESPARLERVKEVIQSAGGQMKAFYLTMGEYDFVTVIEAPDDQTYATTVLRILSQGYVEGHTLKGFTEEEYRRICEGV